MQRKIRLWTKQNSAVLRELEQRGRYTAKRAYIQQDMQEHAGLVLAVYDYLVRHGPKAGERPADAEYPVWLSYTGEAAMLPTPGTVRLELEVEEARITPVNIAKWGAMLNYSYLPADEADARRHRRMLEQYGVSDAKAFMSRFYPEIKKEITDSWSRLFDESVRLGGDACYATVWELRKEWIVRAEL